MAVLYFQPPKMVPFVYGRSNIAVATARSVGTFSRDPVTTYVGLAFPLMVAVW